MNFSFCIYPSWLYRSSCLLNSAFKASCIPIFLYRRAVLLDSKQQVFVSIVFDYNGRNDYKELKWQYKKWKLDDVGNDCAEHTKIAGSSAGSIIATCHHSGLTTDVVAAACLELAEDCRENGTRGRLGVHPPWQISSFIGTLKWTLSCSYFFRASSNYPGLRVSYQVSPGSNTNKSLSMHCSRPSLGKFTPRVHMLFVQTLFWPVAKTLWQEGRTSFVKA